MVTVMTTSDFANEFKNLKSAMIFCHVHPDGDTLSCAFALYYAFLSLGKVADIVCESPLSDIHRSWVPFLPLSSPKNGYDAYISVDVPTPEMLGKNSCNFFLKKQNTYAIDHHASNTKFAKKNLVQLKPACAMICYDIVKQMVGLSDINICNALLLGIMTDTGGYSHADVSAEVFRITAELIEGGADYPAIYDKMYRQNAKERLELFSSAMLKAKYFYDGRFAVITVFTDDLLRYGAQPDYTVGFADKLLSVNTVDVAVSLLESRKDFYRISFRSRKADVNLIAATFGGGGHVHASGAVLSGSFEEVVDKLVFTVGNYL